MSSIPLANWNGVEMPLDQVKVSVLDRAFLFGDAVYEATRVYGGRMWLEREHFDRLARSLREVRIPCDMERLEARTRSTLASSGVKEGLVYIQVTRGEAPRSHAFKTVLTPNELLWVSDYGTDPHATTRPVGVGAVVCDDIRWGRRDIKSVNLLANCMACQRAAEADCPEAVLVDEKGFVTEATHSSVFGVLDGVLRTAPNGRHILPGVTRDYVVRLAKRLDIPCDETSFRREDLPRLSELFLTGTSIEVMPIVRLDGGPVADGRPGPITKKLGQAFQEDVRSWLQRAK